VSDADDPADLPILAELEHEFRAMVAAELRGAAPARVAAPRAPAARTPTPAPPTPAPRRAARRPALAAGRRILGRAVAAGALAGVVGATALATKSVVGHGAPGARLLERAAGHELTLRPYQRRSCLDVAYDGGVASRCLDAPDAGGVRPLSAVTPGGRVVAGLAGRDVARVVVRSGGRRVAVATHALPGGTLRWFSALLPALPREADRAATVAPRRDDGTPAGRAVADCTLGTAASCRAAREHTEVRM